MDKHQQREIDYVCYELNRRIKQMTYEEETCIREFFESCTWEDKFLAITEDETTYIASVLNVNDTCIYDLFVDLGNIEEPETDEEDEHFWRLQDKADDLNDERRLGI